MPTTEEKKLVKNEDGKDTLEYNFKFTNGAVEQLEELKKYFNKNELIEIIELGISVLQRAKDTNIINQSMQSDDSKQVKPKDDDVKAKPQ
jgi:hypothetical protein